MSGNLESSWSSISSLATEEERDCFGETSTKLYEVSSSTLPDRVLQLMRAEIEAKLLYGKARVLVL